MGMQDQNLWAPWRISYLKELGTIDPAVAPGDTDACFFCAAARADLSEAESAERLVLLRDPRGTLLLNRYPYTNGHLLAAPLEHLADLSDMTAAQRAGLVELAELASRLLRAAMNPQGLNIGMNLGQCAGAGVPGHIHMHVVPRWYGDTNFMEVVGRVRVIPQALDESFRALREMVAVVDP